jgi:hypothetical protein
MAADDLDLIANLKGGFSLRALQLKTFLLFQSESEILKVQEGNIVSAFIPKIWRLHLLLLGTLLR